jgi:hypothetical protein
MANLAENSGGIHMHMLLYHFTGLYELQNGGTILAEGLKPADIPKGGFTPGMPHGCVWLTQEPYPAGWWQSEDGSGPECRLTVWLSHDKRLMTYRRWIFKNLPAYERDRLIHALDAELGGNMMWRVWWVYFGCIPLERIKAVEYAAIYHTDPVKRAGAREKYRAD